MVLIPLFFSFNLLIIRALRYLKIFINIGLIKKLRKLNNNERIIYSVNKKLSEICVRMNEVTYVVIVRNAKL